MRETCSITGSRVAPSHIRFLTVLKLLLVAVAFWTWGSASVRADDKAAYVVATDLRFPEGTIFVGDTLYFVDYVRSTVLRLVGGRTEVVWRQPGCGANGLVRVPTGLLVACFDSGTLVEISLVGETKSTIRQDNQGHALVAPNDFVVDRKGGIYFSASGSSGYPGKIFYLGGDHAAREVASGIPFANGVGLSPDGTTLYVAASPTGKILAFPIETDGSLGAARDFIQLRDRAILNRNGPATPDSLRVSEDGDLLVALYNGGGVAIVSPAGTLVTLVNVPAAHHTNLAISPDGKSLYITAVDDDPDTTYRGQIIRVASPLAR